jgi:hypothetical protein
MDNNKHKASYQVNRFISSENYYEFELTPFELVILFIIARYLDMPKGKCFAKQTVMAKECRMSERQFRLSCKKLINYKLIERGMRGKLYHYYLGTNVTKQHEK